MVSLQAALAAIIFSATSQTVMLDFYADWCAPCRAMDPTVQSLIDSGYPVQRVNIDQQKQLAAKYRVQSIPCFVMLVDGQETDRVVGGTTLSRLKKMFDTLSGKRNVESSPVMLAQHTMPPAAPAPAVLPASYEGWATAQQPMQPPPQPTTSEATLLAASVRLKVEDPEGHSCGSGTIIDARAGEALILTCGHIFRDSQGKGRIFVDLFGPHESQQITGRLVSYDLTRDVGLVAITVPGPVTVAKVAPPGYKLQRGAPVVSVGCNNGDPPTARKSQIASLNKFLGPPNIQVADQPVEGRSGGGLFSAEGYVIGVCNAADPSDREGLFAAPESIYAELDRAQLAFVYKSPQNGPTTAPEITSPAVVAANTTITPAADAPTSLPPHEQAALEEIRRHLKDGAEVVCVIRSRRDPTAKSEVIMLDRASPELLKQIAAEVRPQDRPFPTSFESPRPRKVLLEWSATGAK